MSEQKRRPPQSVAALWEHFHTACIPADIPPHARELGYCAFVGGVTALFAELKRADWSDAEIEAMEGEILKIAMDVAGKKLQ